MCSAQYCESGADIESQTSSSGILSFSYSLFPHEDCESSSEILVIQEDDEDKCCLPTRTARLILKITITLLRMIEVWTRILLIVITMIYISGELVLFYVFFSYVVIFCTNTDFVTKYSTGT